MPNYLEKLKERYKLINQADDLMTIYTEIADRLYSEHTSDYSMITNIEIEEDGIRYEYYIDGYDYSGGKDSFFVSREKLESLVEKELRKQKLQKIENNG